METLNYLILIATAVIFYYIGRGKQPAILEQLKEALKKKPKPYGEPFIIDTDEAEIEKKEKAQEKEIVDIDEAIKNEP